MAEYISRNELLKAVQSNVAEAHNERCAQLLEAILNAPSADVVPKSEVEQLKRNLEQCENGYSQELHLARCQLADAKSEVEKLQKELEIWKQNRFNLFQRLGCYEMAKQKIASEIFAEIDKKLNKARLDCRRVLNSEGVLYVSAIRGIISELEKKYTEGEQ